MTDKDPAFLWETAAIRDAPQRVAEIEADDASAAPEAGSWATLREASRATGIPVETLRKWARRGTIPTYLTAAAAGQNIRMVDLEGITLRASELGRTISPPAIASDTGSGEPSTPAEQMVAAEAATAGTMIVPIDAWNKMLNQLGNLHEAGQQLAEARERAAKAETEATFLRERLAELRAESGTPVPAAPDDSPDADAAASTGGETPEDEAPEKVWQFFLRRIRERSTG